MGGNYLNLFYHGHFMLFYFILIILPWSLSVLTFFYNFGLVLSGVIIPNLGTYFLLHFTPLRFVFSEGEGVRIPATSYLVPLFTLIYIVLFHLLLP